MRFSLLCLLALPAVALADKTPSAHLKMALVNIRCEFTDRTDVKLNKAALVANSKRHLNLIDMAVADKGAKILSGPHANTTGGNTAGWYSFRSK